MKEKLCHISRVALPWRAAWQTECGLKIESTGDVMSRAEWIAKVKSEGRGRAAFTTCMTCWETAGRYDYTGVWDEEVALKALRRELEPYHRVSMSVLKADISAIAILIERHRAEFDELVEDYNQTVRLPTQTSKGQKQ